MSNVSPTPSKPRLGRRWIITLALIAVIVVGLVFALSQPVSAPPTPTPNGSSSTGPVNAPPSGGRQVVIPVQPAPPGYEATGESIRATVAAGGDPPIIGTVLPDEPDEATPTTAPKRQASSGDRTASLSTLAGEIVYMSNRDGDFDVYAENLIAYSASAAASASDSLPVNLTNNDSGDGFPSYSLDRVQISYIVQGETELGGYLMNADGTNPTSATADVGTFMNLLFSGRGDWDLRANPDGARTIISLRDLNLEVYYQAAGETSQRNLSQSGAIDWYAQLSPDGTRVVFATDRIDGQQDIYLIDVTGEHFTRLTDSPADDWSPLWLADGSGIVFASERNGRFDGGSLGVYVAYLTGMEAELIPEAVSVDMQTPLATAPIWQNGYGLYMSNETGDWEIYVVDGDGNTVNVTNDPGADLFPVWKPA
ncbi:MAG: hypothetical protein U0670_18930 [Anaerolineae bacterium]